MREPLLLPLIAFMTGIATGRIFGLHATEAGWAAVVFSAFAIAPVAGWLRRTNTMLAVLFAGALLNGWHEPTREPYIETEPREVVLLQGCVVEPAILSDDRTRFALELAEGARALVQMPVAEAGQPVPAGPPYGQRIEVEARLRPPRNFRNPGAFDYAAYLARRDTYWTALMPSHATIRPLEGSCGSAWMGWIYRIRQNALDRIATLAAGDDYAAAMLEAVLVGESSHLERVWTDQFRRSGTYHALVISGLHVSVLAGVLLFLLRFVPISPAKALAVTAIVAWLYALVTGMSTPVIRAATGLTLYLLARLLFRRTRVLNLLAAIALLYLSIDPAALFEASFQLSFLAVAAIGAFAAPLLEKSTSPLARGMRSIGDVSMDPYLEPRVAQLRVEVRLAAETVFLWTRLPERLASPAIALLIRAGLFVFELGVVSAAIQIGLALPMAVYFHRISLTGLSANLLIIPLMSVIVPVGFLALATGWQWTASLAGFLLGVCRAVAAWHSDLEPAWRVPDPPVWIGIALLVALTATAILIRFHRRAWIGVAISLALVGTLIASPWQPEIEPGTLELTVIDVGQGDSLLVVFPEGATMLIDGGGRPDYGRDPGAARSGLDMGEDVVAPYLWSRRIRRIDILAATHAHQDHVGGLASLMEAFRPAELWTGANPPSALLQQARDQGIRVVQQRADPARPPFVISGARIEVLAPTADYAAAQPGNNDSLVLRIQHGHRSFLLAGDVERAVEQRILDSVKPADVLKVGHHGSRTSTTLPFLEAVSPSIAVISAGFQNSYGHPHPEVVERLEAHSTVLRTDRTGYATIRTDGDRLWYDVAAWHDFSRPLRLPVHLIN